jgi:hypothetical protein
MTLAKNTTEVDTSTPIFRARACPSFSYTSVKMSTKPLTRASSPVLRTKLRSARKLKN